MLDEFAFPRIYSRSFRRLPGWPPNPEVIQGKYSSCDLGLFTLESSQKHLISPVSLHVFVKQTRSDASRVAN